MKSDDLLGSGENYLRDVKLKAEFRPIIVMKNWPERVLLEWLTDFPCNNSHLFIKKESQTFSKQLLELKRESEMTNGFLLYQNKYDHN